MSAQSNSATNGSAIENCSAERGDCGVEEEQRLQFDACSKEGGHGPERGELAKWERHLQEPHPGDTAIERRIKSLVRWNAMAMVVRANRESSELGGHIASFASAATLYDVGLNHFFRAPSHEHGGDLIFMQGHSAPGIYARAYLEGRMNEEQLERVFEEFQQAESTTSRDYGGTGLGLSVSYFIVVENHRGTMTVERAPSSGCRFVIRLPTEPAVTVQPPTSHAPSPVAGEG